MNEKIKKIKAKFEKTKEKYFKDIEKIQKKCTHEWETFTGYDGTTYSCKICDKNL